MSEWVFIVFFAIWGIVILTTSASLLADWNNKMKLWKSVPSIYEIINCSLDGFIGIVGIMMGGLIWICVICSIINIYSLL